MIFYAITNNNSIVTIYINKHDYDVIYDMVMNITNDHQEAENALNWCELASVNEIYEGSCFTIEIFDDCEEI